MPVRSHNPGNVYHYMFSKERKGRAAVADSDSSKPLWRLAAGRVPGGHKAYDLIRSSYRAVVQEFDVQKLTREPPRLASNREPPVIVSLTSFPERIGRSVLAIESLLHQENPPNGVVLVLSEDQFPRRSIPLRIGQLQKRGLEILWIREDLRDLKKLVPTIQTFPEATVITADDDLQYKPWATGGLIAAHQRNPTALVGYRGWEIGVLAGSLKPYNEWVPADSRTPSRQLFLTGGSGIAFPPGLMPVDLLCDTRLAMELCPTASDVWIWVVARVAGIHLSCLAKNSFHPVVSLRKTAALMDANVARGQNDIQIANAMKYFNISVD